MLMRLTSGIDEESRNEILQQGDWNRMVSVVREREEEIESWIAQMEKGMRIHDDHPLGQKIQIIQPVYR